MYNGWGTWRSGVAGLRQVYRSRCWSDIALGVSPISGSYEGSVGLAVTGDGGVDDEDGLGISFSSRKNFLFLNVTLPVPSTFTAYWS